MKERGIKIALDDFGSGFAGLELLYHSDPGFLKFDRFLISGIESDYRKRNICTHLIALCRTQGIATIAEGIESAAAARVCADIGFNFLQGYEIAVPSISLAELRESYPCLTALGEPRRRRGSDVELIRREILQIETISVEADARQLLEKFHERKSYNFFPVLDTNGVPLGIVHEKNLKEYVYSPFGRELLSNRSVTRGLRSFITPCPAADIHTPQDKILEIFMAHPDCEGVIIVQNAVYFGFLNAKSLLSLVHDKNLNEARDMNPLTRLPGNNVIHAFIGEAIAKNETYAYFIYFDFDHFKPFNDRFGFRQGDRAILLFVEILRRLAPPECVAGHIGGDDFFIGFESADRRAEETLYLVETLQQAFDDAVKPFFSPDERARGYYVSTDRENKVREFPILTISAAVVELIPGEKPTRVEDISVLLAKLKKEAKKSAQHSASAAYKS